jgi:hypothetical protein
MGEHIPFCDATIAYRIGLQASYLTFIESIVLHIQLNIY